MTPYQERLITAVNQIIGRLPEHEIANAVGYLEERFGRLIFDADVRELEERRRADRKKPRTQRPIIEAGGNIVAFPSDEVRP